MIFIDSISYPFRQLITRLVKNVYRLTVSMSWRPHSHRTKNWQLKNKETGTKGKTAKTKYKPPVERIAAPPGWI
jgi:hypothetical protein